ncbi:tRNA-splicing endonuclease subunit [Serendipita sp. 396]|nr:tRNA-splicing endonuclease subunit [Serendipita sp. 396]KAG8787417.1 tRNA-splicing endonuclease subunit [Serendipita sp. 397]KAG8802785.1 tRNA-splicing endonuclease subunit [Serendipita sp. 398]KAG8873081.1 tRNA-splicing endonuclease subunit [Serendipita sp. 405]
MSDPHDGKIPLHISNETAFVWSLDDAATLRATYHICGVLTGTLPQAAQQNVFLGLPLMLMPEEVVLLVNNGVALLIDDSASHTSPSAEELSLWNEQRRAALSRVPKKTGLLVPPTLSDEALKRRLERQKRKEAQTTPSVESEELMTLESPSPLTPKASSKELSYSFTIPAASDFPWYHSKCYSSIKEARNAGIWKYPETPEAQAKCAVFEDLWKQGYFMGNGLRFGGDWLVYPGVCFLLSPSFEAIPERPKGDPLRFHSHFVATVLPSPTTEIQPIQIVAYGRLGTATKKAHMLCCWDESTRKVSYYSIEWAGFG